MPVTATLEDRIADLKVQKGSVAVVWLGQAGYLLKTPAGTIVMIDPYLSDWAGTQWGLQRRYPAPIDPRASSPTAADLHWHEVISNVPL